jgi:glycosyltransferase involved in cell wall biosynthesis
VTVPLVSVVIPMFNAAAFIGDALDSVAAQSHPRLEVVVVDDGSTDASAEVVEGHRARLVRPDGLEPVEVRVLHQANQGPAVARNLALDHVRGDFVTMLDADDAMVGDRIAFGMTHLGAHPDTDAVVGTHVNVVDEGVEPPPWLAAMTGHQEVPHYLVMTVLARVGLFERVGGFDPSYQFAGEDTEWYLRARSSGARIDLVDHLMLIRRIHGANLTYQVEDLDRALFRLLRERARRARSTPAP